MKIEPDFVKIAESSIFVIYRLVTDKKWQENCFLVENSQLNTCVILDPGDCATTILKMIEERNLKVVGMLLTHGHHDHVGALEEIAFELDVPVLLHEKDEPLIRMAHNYAAILAKKYIKPIRRKFFVRCPGPEWVGFENLEVIHSPGHTPGSLCFRIEDYLFTGDTLLYESVGRTDIPGGDPFSLVQSISQLFESNTDSIVILPGHGDSWSFPEALIWWKSESDNPKPYDYFGKP